jgi:hypothetical protein
MGDEEYGDEESMTQVGAAPLAVFANLGSQYTSKEAYDLAKKLYDDLNVERSKLGVEEDETGEDMARMAEEAKAQLRAARDRLLTRKYDQAEKWLALAEGFGTPTRSGGFGETLGNVARGQREVNANRRTFQSEQEKGVLTYEQQIGAIDRALAKAKLDTNAARREANVKLLQEAMRTLRREVRDGAGSGAKAPPSQFGKIAMDMGFEPGTPEYHAKVAELQAADAKNRAATAGTDATAGTVEEALAQQDLAYKYGVPAAPDPYKGMSTKQRTAAMAIEQRDTQKRLEEMATKRSDAVEGIAKMNRFLQLNMKQDTGAVKGLFPALSSAAQEMDAITAEVARKMKQPGEGQVSDFDGKQFRLATVSRSKNFQANRGVATAYKIMRKNEIDRINFMHDYATLNGHLRGADVAWRNYLEANPIFDPSAPDTFKLNENRQKDYRVWFREQMGDKPAVGDEPLADEAGDEDPWADPADNLPAVPATQAHAGGGKVSVLRRSLRTLDDNTAQGVRHRELVRRRKLYDTMFEEGSINEQEYEDALSKVEAQLRKTGYAKGGVVSDEDIYGVPGDAPIDETEDEDDGSGGLRDALNAALQGATMGTADEIRSIYDPEGAAQDRAKLSEYAGEHPAHKAISFAAGMAPLAAAAPGGGGLLASLLLGGGTGALLGATSNVEDRDVGALQGGIEGSLIGAASAFGTRYLYNKAGQLVDRATGRALSPVEEKLVLSANRDKVDLAQVAADLRTSDRQGVPQGVQDVAGRRTRALIERAATRGGEESENFLRERQGVQDKATSRVEDQINKGLAPSEYFGEMDKLQTGLYNNSKPLYDKAYKMHPSVKSKEFMALMDTRDGKRAFREALRLMELEGKPIGKANAAGIIQKPSLEFLDYYKRGLDQLIATEEKGGPTTLGRALRNSRNRLRDELDNAAPEYKAARAQYAGDLEVRDALQMGRSDINKMQPEEVRRAISKMSFAEKDAFRSGVSQHLFEILGKPTTDFNAAQRILGSDSMREKLRATFDDPKKWKVFEAALDKEAEMFKANKQLLGRVEGKKLQALGKEDSILSNALDRGMTNAPGMGGISWVNRIYNWLRFPLPMSEKTADDLLRTINRGDVKAFDATMHRLAQAQPRLSARGKRAGKMAAVAAVLGAGLTQPTPPGEATKMEEK